MSATVAGGGLLLDDSIVEKVAEGGLGYREKNLSLSIYTGWNGDRLGKRVTFFCRDLLSRLAFCPDKGELGASGLSVFIISSSWVQTPRAVQGVLEIADRDPINRDSAGKEDVARD